MAGPSDRRCKGKASFPKNLQLKLSTKPTGVIKVKDETLWLSSEAGAWQWSCSTYRTSLLAGLREAQLTRKKRKDAGTCKCTQKKKGFLHFLSSLFLMSPPKIIFVFYRFFVMLLEFPYFPSGFGVFRTKVIFTLGWLKLCRFLFPRHSWLNLATFTVSAEINTWLPLYQVALIR